jgi:PIN domain nuclease of toxin-antitoxin system
VEGTFLKYILDTAPWINSVTIPGVIPKRILDILATEEEKGVCSVSLLETARLYHVGRLRLNGTLNELFSKALAENVRLLELTPEIAVTTTLLPADFQADPFDRTIAATTRTLGVTLITCDPLIRDSGVCPVEFYAFKPSRIQGRTSRS